MFSPIFSIFLFSWKIEHFFIPSHSASMLFQIWLGKEGSFRTIYFFTKFTFIAYFSPTINNSYVLKGQQNFNFSGIYKFNFYQTLPGSSFAESSHFTSTSCNSHKAWETINPAVWWEIWKNWNSSAGGGPSRLNSFFHVQFSQFKAYTSFMSLAAVFPP